MKTAEHKYHDNKKIILFGAGKIGLSALHHYGTDRVFCFADNFAYGQRSFGKDVISFDELLKIHNKYEVVVSVGTNSAGALMAQCLAHGICTTSWKHTTTWRDYESKPEISKFKNIHAGKRCFLIGNGPSLNAEDLNKLAENNIVSFGCNKINSLFSCTKWRPDYFFVCDKVLIQICYEEFAQIDVKTKFVQDPGQFVYDERRTIVRTLESGKGNTYFYNKLGFSKDNNNIFSEDPSRAMLAIGTVMYPMIQMAVYMGFNEIYLLGVDNSMMSMNDLNVFNSSKSHFYDENPQENERLVALSGNIDMDNRQVTINDGYLAAEKYSREHGIKIFNTTRGGKLEAFERVDFDTLF